MKTYEGNLDGNGLKIQIVAARFNHFITDRLVEGAIDSLKRHGVEESNITISLVPGAFEIPLVVSKIAEKKDCDAIITLGAAMRGSTTHYELVTGELAKGIAQVSLANSMPIIFGVVTTEDIEQAIEMANLMKIL